MKAVAPNRPLAMGGRWAMGDGSDTMIRVGQNTVSSYLWVTTGG